MRKRIKFLFFFIVSFTYVIMKGDDVMKVKKIKYYLTLTGLSIMLIGGCVGYYKIEQHYNMKAREVIESI